MQDLRLFSPVPPLDVIITSQTVQVQMFDGGNIFENLIAICFLVQTRPLHHVS